MGVQDVFNQSCANKQKFKTRENALKRVREIAKRGRIISEKNIYLCDFCGRYHLGHSWKIDKVLEKVRLDDMKNRAYLACLPSYPGGM